MLHSIYFQAANTIIVQTAEWYSDWPFQKASVILFDVQISVMLNEQHQPQQFRWCNNSFNKIMIVLNKLCMEVNKYMEAVMCNGVVVYMWYPWICVHLFLRWFWVRTSNSNIVNMCYYYLHTRCHPNVAVDVIVAHCLWLAGYPAIMSNLICRNIHLIYLFKFSLQGKYTARCDTTQYGTICSDDEVGGKTNLDIKSCF